MKKLFLLFALLSISTSFAEIIKVGKGAYTTTPPKFINGSYDKDNPGLSRPQNIFGPAINPGVSNAGIKWRSLSPAVTEEFRKSGKRVTTNQFWSSVVFKFNASRYSNQMHPGPLSLLTNEQGILLFSPLSIKVNNYIQDKNINNGQTYTKANIYAVTGTTDQLRVGIEDMTVDSTLLDDYGDWHARIALKADTNILMKATIARGTPYIFFENVKGKPTIGRNIDNPNSRFSIFYEKNNVIAFKNESTKEYWVLCLPEGATYELKDKQPGELGPFFKNCIVDLNGKNYFSIGLLFDSCKTENEIKTIAKYAFSVIRDTRVNWKYDSTKNTITTNYKFYTKSFMG